MQTDVYASAVRTTDGQLADFAGNDLGRVRVRAVYIVPGASAGSVVFKDGGTGGAARLTLNTVASATQPTYMLLPGEGMLFSNDVYVDVTNIGSVMVYYA
jgi:hypothetical protein